MLSRLNFITILFIGFLNYLGIALVYPLFAIMLFDPSYPLVSSGASSACRGTLLGILIGLTPLMQFFSAPLLGAFSDFKGRKKTLVYSSMIGVLAYGLAVLGIQAHSFALLFLYRILIGVAAGMVPVAQAMIADSTAKENKARRFSLFSASLGLGFTVGPFLGGKLADPSLGAWCGYVLPFIAAGILCVLNLLLVVLHFPETHKVKENAVFHPMKSLHNIRKVFLWKKLRMLFLATFLFAFGWSFFNEFIPILLRQQFAFQLSDIGNYYAYGGAWYAFCSAVTSAILLKYFSPQKIGVKSLIGSAVCMLSFLLFEDRQYIWLILPFLMFFLTFTYPITGALVSNRANAENQGEVLGVYQSVIGCAMGLSPFFAGSLIGMFPKLTAIGGAFVMLAAALALWRGMQKSA